MRGPGGEEGRSTSHDWPQDNLSATFPAGTGRGSAWYVMIKLSAARQSSSLEFFLVPFPCERVLVAVVPAWRTLSSLAVAAVVTL